MRKKYDVQRSRSGALIDWRCADPRRSPRRVDLPLRLSLAHFFSPLPCGWSCVGHERVAPRREHPPLHGEGHRAVRGNGRRAAPNQAHRHPGIVPGTAVYEECICSVITSSAAQRAYLCRSGRPGRCLVDRLEIGPRHARARRVHLTTLREVLTR